MLQESKHYTSRNLGKLLLMLICSFSFVCTNNAATVVESVLQPFLGREEGLNFYFFSGNPAKGGGTEERVDY